MAELSPEQEKLRNDLVLYSRTGKLERLAECIDLLEGDLNFRWGDYPPLGHAADRGRHAAVQLLLERGAFHSCPGTMGLTPLILAARSRSIECVRLLLSAGADANQKDAAGQVAIDHARQVRAGQVVEILEMKTKDPWEQADVRKLDSLDPILIELLLEFIKRSIAGGEHGEIDGGNRSLPPWYSNLLASVPLAGISFSCRPAASKYKEWGRFFSSIQFREYLEDEPDFQQELLNQGYSPIADANDGNAWCLKDGGDEHSPVFMWDHSGMEGRAMYANFQSFVEGISGPNQG